MEKPQRRKLQGRVFTTTNGHNSYEIDNATPEIILKISDMISARFGFDPPDIPGVGLDTVITRSTRGDIVLSLGWDIWSGFYLMGNTTEGDHVVNEIGAYLDSVIEGDEFDQYIQSM